MLNSLLSPPYLSVGFQTEGSSAVATRESVIFPYSCGLLDMESSICVNLCVGLAGSQRSENLPRS